MLEKIRLTSYRAFEDTGDIRIAPVTLLLGKNNSGKSSLLKALSFIHDGLADGSRSRLSLRSESGVISGASMADLFHRRRFTDLGLFLEFSQLNYEIHLVSNNGKTLPSSYRIAASDGSPEKTRQGADQRQPRTNYPSFPHFHVKINHPDIQYSITYTNTYQNESSHISSRIRNQITAHYR